MALLDPYCTIAEADVFLASSSSWNASTDSEKNTSLFWGRMYIDSNYTCLDWTDTTLFPDYPLLPENLKYANALLADEYLNGGLFNTSPSGDKEVVKKRVKAGDVEAETTYRGESGSDAGGAVDPFPAVSALLAAWCSVNGVSGLCNIKLIRT